MWHLIEMANLCVSMLFSPSTFVIFFKPVYDG